MRGRNNKKMQTERERERLRKGQKIYFSGSSKVVPARPSSKSNLPLTLKYALTYFLIAKTLLLYYKECLVGVLSEIMAVHFNNNNNNNNNKKKKKKKSILVTRSGKN